MYVNILAQWQQSKAKKSEAMGISGAEEREYCKRFLRIHQTSKNERTAQS